VEMCSCYPSSSAVRFRTSQARCRESRPTTGSWSLVFAPTSSATSAKTSLAHGMRKTMRVFPVFLSLTTTDFLTEPFSSRISRQVTSMASEIRRPNPAPSATRAAYLGRFSPRKWMAKPDSFQQEDRLCLGHLSLCVFSTGFGVDIIFDCASPDLGK